MLIISEIVAISRAKDTFDLDESTKSKRSKAANEFRRNTEWTKGKYSLAVRGSAFSTS